MGKKIIMVPEGHELFEMSIRDDCKNAPVYKNGGVKPPNRIVLLSQGEGRTTLVNFMVDMYRAFGVIDFSSGLDYYLEFTLDGSPKQLKRIRAEIESAAVYRNQYEGIIVMDPTAMAKHLNESQMRDLVGLIEDVSPYATLLFFYPNRPNKSELHLMEKLREPADNPLVIEYEELSEHDLTRIAQRYITERGIRLDDPDRAYNSILSYIEYNGLSLASEAVDFAKMLLMDVDYSNPIPLLTGKAIAMYTDEDYEVCEDDRKKVER